MNDDLPTKKLPEEPEQKPIDPNNIDWTGEVFQSRLEKVPILFPQNVVKRALYSERSHVLNSYTGELSSDVKFDLNKSRAKLVEYINVLLQDSSGARITLASDFNFVTVLKPIDTSSEQSLRNYQQERLILVQALEQALTLIVADPILKNLVSTYLAYNGHVPDVEIPNLQDQVRNSGLPIWIQRGKEGFGDKDNHGTLDIADGKIRLVLDEMGRFSVKELVHEYAAFLIIATQAKLQNESITTEVQLKESKQIYLTYILIMLDLILANTSETTRYTNLAGRID